MSNLYTLPIRTQATTITRQLSEAIFDFVLNAIHQELPDEQQPEQFAHSLIAIADEHQVPIEAVRDWLGFKQPRKEFTSLSFTRWAQAYEDTRSQVLQAQRHICTTCGGPLQILEDHFFCGDCGEASV